VCACFLCECVCLSVCVSGFEFVCECVCRESKVLLLCSVISVLCTAACCEGCIVAGGRGVRL
jgi:hypothetical protein